MRPRTPALLLVATLAAFGAASSLAQDAPGALVTMADGSSVPLVSYALSYEYVAWRAGTLQYQVAPQRRDGAEVYSAKHSYPVAGKTLAVVYTARASAKVATGLTLTGTDKKPLKLEPPHRDLVVPNAEKGMTVVVRTLDLKGVTLAGTRREFCLLSFTSLVECPDEPGNQVVRIEFQ